MKLTKYAHACVVLEKDGQRLLIDPGNHGSDFGGTANIAGIVITHNHADHFDPKLVQAVIAANPEVVIVTTTETAQELTHKNVVTPKAGGKTVVGPFSLSFTGGQHDFIYKDFPKGQNIGVDIDNGAVYFPGDSFAMPPGAVTVLLTPVSGPWLKLGESLAYLEAVKPKVCIPTHDGMFSEHGRQNADGMLQMICEQLGTQHQYLLPSESFEF